MLILLGASFTTSSAKCANGFRINVFELFQKTSAQKDHGTPLNEAQAAGAVRNWHGDRAFGGDSLPKATSLPAVLSCQLNILDSIIGLA